MSVTPTEILAMCRDPRADVAEAGRLLAAQMRLPRKVLVTDLDGTLWAGQLAEGDLLDPNPDLIEALERVRDLGGLLAVATWNAKDVQFALPIMVGLDAERLFAAIECGYDPKPAMLRRIAAKLNLSVDSVVFVDDDPMQRAHVAQELPGVIVLTPDDDPVPYFEPVVLTDEDRRRAQMYQEEKAREAAKQDAASPDAFLRSLGMKIRIERCRPEQRARVVQLFERTTQFNLTGQRFTETQLAEVEAHHGLVLVASVTDRFGDSGLVAAAVATPCDYDRYLHLDNFVMSCRVLGRGVETAVWRSLLKRTPEERLSIAVHATERNDPATRFAVQVVAGTLPSCDHAEIEDVT